MSSDSEWADASDRLMPAKIDAHRMFVIDVGEIDGKHYHFLGTEPRFTNDKWHFGYRVTILSDAIVSIKTITNRKKQLPDKGRTVKEKLTVANKRGCKTAADSSNTCEGTVLNAGNVGANPPSAATPQIHIKDTIIGKDVIK